MEMLEKMLRGVEKKRSTCRGFELFPKAAALVRKVEKLPGGAWPVQASCARILL